MERERTEVRETTVAGDTNRQVVQENTKASSGTVARRVVYYIGGLIIALIGLRFIFLMLGANQGSGFVDFIYGVSAPFVAPFTGIFGEPTFGASYFESASLVAIIVYALVTIGIGKLFTLRSPRA